MLLQFVPWKMPYACFGMPAARLNIDHFFNSCNKFLLVEAQTSSFLTHKKKTCSEFEAARYFQFQLWMRSASAVLRWLRARSVCPRLHFHATSPTFLSWDHVVSVSVSLFRDERDTARQYSIAVSCMPLPSMSRTGQSV